MTLQIKSPKDQTVPQLVRAVLIEATRWRQQGCLSQELFEAQIERITSEELTPRRLNLVALDLEDGTRQFVVTSKTDGHVCELIDCSYRPAA